MHWILYLYAYGTICLYFYLDTSTTIMSYLVLTRMSDGCEGKPVRIHTSNVSCQATSSVFVVVAQYKDSLRSALQNKARDS